MSLGQRVAVVGCGRMGAQRARAAHRLGAELVLSDGDEERSRLLASEFPSASTAPPQRLDWAALDAVFVCTPAGARGPRGGGAGSDLPRGAAGSSKSR